MCCWHERADMSRALGLVNFSDSSFKLQFAVVEAVEDFVKPLLSNRLSAPCQLPGVKLKQSQTVVIIILSIMSSTSCMQKANDARKPKIRNTYFLITDAAMLSSDRLGRSRQRQL